MEIQKKYTNKINMIGIYTAEANPIENWKDQNTRNELLKEKQRQSPVFVPSIPVAQSLQDRINWAKQFMEEHSFTLPLYVDNMENEISYLLTGNGFLGICVVQNNSNKIPEFLFRTGLPPFDFDVDILLNWIRSNCATC